MSVWSEKKKEETQNIHTHLHIHTLTHSLSCPECGSSKIYKDGLRYTSNGEVQRFLCRDCGFRFSDTTALNVKDNNSGFSQQNNSSRGLDLLAALDETKTSAGLTGNQTQDGYIIDFAWKMKKRNKAVSTIQNRILYLSRLVKLGADLTKPDTVETVFATEEWTDSAKYNAVKAYKAFATAFKIEWDPIEAHYEPKEPFYPQEEEVDLLINACSKVTATFLQVAKDTGARVGEIRKIEWTDIDDKNNTIAINHPEKGSRARTVKVTEKTIAMVKNLKKITANTFLTRPLYPSEKPLTEQGQKWQR
jgi:predicted RNA-binding Zn-ribbon protein involved in translation (DUF1610 family)